MINLMYSNFFVGYMVILQKRIMERLTELKTNLERRVVDITAEGALRERLLEMGLAPGRSVRRLGSLPLGGPTIIQAGSLFLALRRHEAESVWVE
jgi:Fe2+ transport system protein FeoA